MVNMSTAVMPSTVYDFTDLNDLQSHYKSDGSRESIATFDGGVEWSSPTVGGSFHSLAALLENLMVVGGTNSAANTNANATNDNVISGTTIIVNPLFAGSGDSTGGGPPVGNNGAAQALHRKLDRCKSEPIPTPIGILAHPCNTEYMPSPIGIIAHPSSGSSAASSCSSSSSSSALKTPLINVNTSRYKTELCRPFEENGMCKYGDKCQFAHGEGELRGLVRHPKYKTEFCRTFHSIGFCPYGPRCHFIHNADEARQGQGSGGAGGGTASTVGGTHSPSLVLSPSTTPGKTQTSSPLRPSVSFSPPAPIGIPSPPSPDSRLPVFNRISATTILQYPFRRLNELLA